jgi:DNA-binding MarR family transcriptional regulator
MLKIAKEYLEKLKSEVTKREKLLTLELAIKEAREKKDKELEKNLTAQFAKISLDKS